MCIYTYIYIDVIDIYIHDTNATANVRLPFPP